MPTTGEKISKIQRGGPSNELTWNDPIIEMKEGELCESLKSDISLKFAIYDNLFKMATHYREAWCESGQSKPLRSKPTAV